MSDITMKELGDILAKRGLTIKITATRAMSDREVKYRAVVTKNGGRNVLDGGGWTGVGVSVESAILGALYDEKNENREMSAATGSDRE